MSDGVTPAVQYVSHGSVSVARGLAWVGIVAVAFLPLGIASLVIANAALSPLVESLREWVISAAGLLWAVSNHALLLATGRALDLHRGRLANAWLVAAYAIPVLTAWIVAFSVRTAPRYGGEFDIEHAWLEILVSICVLAAATAQAGHYLSQPSRTTLPWAVAWLLALLAVVGSAALVLSDINAPGAIWAVGGAAAYLLNAAGWQLSQWKRTSEVSR